MKKVLVVVLLLAVGGLAFPWVRAYQDLQKVNQGQIYTWSLLTIEIPKDSASLKGFPKPEIEIKNVKLVFDKLDVEATVPVSLLKSRGWSREHLILELPQLKDEKSKLQLDQVKILFSKSAKSFEGLEVGSLQEIGDQQSAAHNLQFLIHQSKGLFPEHLELRVGDITSKKSPEESIVLKDLMFQVQTRPSGARRHVEVHVKGQGSFDAAGNHGVLEPFDVTLNGDMNEVPAAEFSAYQNKVSALFAQMKKAKESPTTNPSSDCIPSEEGQGGVAPSTPEDCIPGVVPDYSGYSKDQSQEEMYAFMKETIQFLQKVDLKALSQKFDWRGLNVKTKEGQVLVVVEPVTGNAQWTYEAESFSYKADFEAKKLSVNNQSLVPFKMLVEGIRLNSEANYKVSYQAYMKKQFESYVKIFDKSSFGMFGPSPFMFLDMILSQLPDATQGGLTIKNIEYDTMGIKGHHHDIKLDAGMLEQAIKLALVYHFSHEEADQPEKSFKEALINLQLNFDFPWGELVKSVRAGKDLSGPDIFYNKNIGVQLKGETDLGVNWFKVVADIDLATLFPQLPPPPPPPDFSKMIPKEGEDPEKAMQEAMKESQEHGNKVKEMLINSFAEKGKLQFKVSIDRFSKLKKFIESKDPQFDEKFKAGAAYYKYDEAADRLSTEIVLKDKGIVVNGQVDPILSALLHPGSAPTAPKPLQ